MTDRKTMIAAAMTLGVLFLGAIEPAPAAWDRPATVHAPTGDRALAQAQDRGRAGGRFQTEPEFPPQGYLEDIEDPPRARADASGQDRFQDPLPPLGGAGQSPVIAPATPVYVPEGLGGGMPSGGPREQADPRGAGSGSLGGWGAPAFTPPASGQDTYVRRHDRGAGRVGFPAAPADPAERGWVDFPAEEAWAERMSDPENGTDHQWPLAPPTEGGYPSASEYASEVWDGTRPRAAPAQRPPFPEYPRGGLNPSR